MDKVTPQAMQVNYINQPKFHKQRKEQHTNKGMKDARNPKAQRPGGNSPQRCYNCNRPGHHARDASCFARDKRCDKCGTRGHFSAVERNETKILCPDGIRMTRSHITEKLTI